MILKILGWIIWLICLFFALGASASYSKKLKVADNMAHRVGTFYQAYVLWLLVVWTLCFSQMNKLHLLWLVPLMFCVATWFSILRLGYVRVGKRLGVGSYAPPAFIVIMIILGPILYLLTFL